MMTEGKDIWYFFYAYTSAFLLFVGYVIYLAAKVAHLHGKVERLSGRERPENDPSD